jgi:hypothetical protein
MFAAEAARGRSEHLLEHNGELRTAFETTLQCDFVDRQITADQERLGRIDPPMNEIAVRREPR